MLSIGKKLIENEAKEFNKNVTLAQLNGRGHVATLACKGCHTLISDSICLCSGCFDCPVCGYENGDRSWQQVPIVRFEWYYEGDELKCRRINE